MSDKDEDQGHHEQFKQKSKRFKKEHLNTEGIAHLREEQKRRYEERKNRLKELLQRENELEFDFQPIAVKNIEDDFSLSFIPVECMVLIFGFLDIQQLCHSVPLVCKGWNLLAKFDDLWEYLYRFYHPTSSNLELIRKSHDSWIEAFKWRYELRKKWKYQTYTETAHMDFYQEELNPRLKKPFQKDSFDDDEKNKKKLIRHQILSMSLSGFDKLIVSDTGGRVRVWSLRTKQPTKTLKAHKSNVNCVAANNSVIVTGGDRMDANIFVWDAKTCTLIDHLKNPKLDKKKVTRYPVCFILKHDLLGISFSDSSAEVWELKSRKIKSYFNKPLPKKTSNTSTSTSNSNNNDSGSDSDNDDDHSDDDDDDQYDDTYSYRGGRKSCLFDIDENHAAILNHGKISIYDLRIGDGICIKNIEYNPKSPKNSNPSATTTGVVPAPSDSVSKHILFMQLVNVSENIPEIAIISSELGKSNHNKASYFLRFYNIKSGKEITSKKVRIVEYFSQYQYPISAYFDQDKILLTYSNQVIVHDRASGIPIAIIPVTGKGYPFKSSNLDTSYSSLQISSSLVDEMTLVVSTSVGGLVYRSFANPNLYWSSLEGGKTLASS